MIPRALVACAVLTLLAAVFAFKASARMPDFEVYWRAGHRAAAAEPLYRPEDEHYQLKYLPAFAILAIPVAQVPLGAAKALWFAASVALLAALVALSLALLPERRKPAWVLAALSVVALAKFYGHELVLGQVNALLAVTVVSAVHLAVRRPTLAGLLLALAIVVKPYAILFLPWLAAIRAHRAWLAALGGLGLALAAPAAVYGLPGTVALHHDWWHTVTTSTAPNLLNADNVSVAAMYAKWLGPGPAAARLAAVTGGMLLLAAAATLWPRARVRAPSGLEAALLLTLMPLLSPQGWDYVFLVSTPAVIYLLNYEGDLPRALRTVTWLALATIAFSLYDVMGRQAYQAFMAWSVISVCYLALIVALVALRLRRAA